MTELEELRIREKFHKVALVSAQERVATLTRELDQAKLDDRVAFEAWLEIRRRIRHLNRKA